MREPPSPANESLRLSALESLRLFHSPAEERFDRITRMARRYFKTPIALISLVGSDKQWFKSSQGLLAAETPREVSFCGHAIARDQALVITDTLTDPDFADNPLVVEDPQIRFYAGQPVRFQNAAVGTLCIIDRQPREFSSEDLDSLQILAAFVEAEFNLTSMSAPEQELLSEIKQADRQVLIDPLTQTWNKAALDILIIREIALGLRNKEPFTLSVVKIGTNDQTLSALDASDQQILVREVCQRIRSALRPYDLMGRLDNDHIVIFSPGCGADVIELLIDRVHSRVTSNPVQIANSMIDITFEAGIAATIPGRDVTRERLIEVAELALTDALKAKQTFLKYIT